MAMVLRTTLAIRRAPTTAPTRIHQPLIGALLAVLSRPPSWFRRAPVIPRGCGGDGALSGLYLSDNSAVHYRGLSLGGLRRCAHGSRLRPCWGFARLWGLSPVDGSAVRTAVLWYWPVIIAIPQVPPCLRHCRVRYKPRGCHHRRPLTVCH
jgi:hypothetical protein